MRKLRELTTRVSLAELLDVLEAQIVDGETAPPVRPEGEKEFVRTSQS